MAISATFDSRSGHHCYPVRHHAAPSSFMARSALTVGVSHSIGTRPVLQYGRRYVSGSGQLATLHAHPEYGTLGGMSMTQDRANVISKLHQWPMGARHVWRHVREPQPGESGRPHRRRAAIDARGRGRRGRRRRARRLADWRLVPAPQRAEILYRAARDPDGAQGGLRARR